MKESSHKKEMGTGSLRKAITVLKCFSEERVELSMTEVAHLTNLPIGTASRILAALRDENLLEREERSKLYRLGVYCMRMGKIAKHSGALRSCALPFMERLRDRFNETVNLYLREDLQRVCYAQCETTSPLRRSVPLGSRFPLSAGAAGRCLLAWMTYDFVQSVLSGLKPFTENTITDIAEIQKLIERTRLDHFAVSYSEREKGVTAVAVPIFDAPDSVCASMSITGPDMRFTKEVIGEMIAALKKTSEELSGILSGG
ncbi:IclR family transcriptional regulator [Synergistales bacterium]|nr:IclR family transcriptional regulator [Synergistales bacterium]